MLLHRVEDPECGGHTVWLAQHLDAAHVGFHRNSAILQCMKANITITGRGMITLLAKLRRALGLKAEDRLMGEITPEGLLLRPAITLPVEIYTPERVREFNAAEQELAANLRAKTSKRASRRKSKSAR